MIFPPIFAYVIFFVLDLFSFIFYLFVVTAPLGTFLASFTTFLYVIRIYMKYGPKKGTERLFKFKNMPIKKVVKKGAKVFGSAIIPFLTVWAVYDDYKEDLAEAKNKEVEAKDKKAEIKKAVATAATIAAVAATGGAAAPAAAGRMAAGRAAAGAGARGAAGKAGQSKISQMAKDKFKDVAVDKVVDRMVPEESEIYDEEDFLETEYEGALEGSKEESGRAEKMEINPWIKRTQREPFKKYSREDMNKKTVAEEVGGIKTGLKREDYDEGITDFSRPETYEKILIEKEAEKKEKELRRQEDEADEAVKKKMEEATKKQAYDRAFIRRFGPDAYQRMVQDRNLKEADLDLNSSFSLDAKGKEKASNKNKEGDTIFEELTGIKTGLNIEDYNQNITDYTKPDAYQELIKEERKNKELELEKEREKEIERKIKKGVREFSYNQAYDRAIIRRYGKEAFQKLKKERESKEIYEKKSGSLSKTKKRIQKGIEEGIKKENSKYREEI